MKPRAIHHVAIEVKEIAQAVSWYLDHFDCKILYQDESWALLQFSNINLAFVLPGQHPPHLGFLHEDILQFGQPVLHRDHTRSVYITDPDGNALEMVESPHRK